ncbi:MAG TPA: hypothetical protein DCZ76_03700 [Treponema sp.]|nr:hypothetical protein [Treponema sp.]
MKKSILVFTLLFTFYIGLYALKIIDITQHISKMATWVEEYYLLEKKYPETLEDILQKDFNAFDYDLDTYYKSLRKEGYKAFVSDKKLILIDRHGLERCEYDFEEKNFLLYKGSILIDIFKSI